MLALSPTPRRIRRPSRALAAIIPATGPLDTLTDLYVLVLADDENLRCGARDLGFRLCYGRLAQRLRSSARRCGLHAFFSRQPGDDRRCRYFRESGWLSHPRDIEAVRTCRGTQYLANSDNDLLFAAGILANRGNPEVIVLGSGDGDLVCDLARNLRQLCRSQAILTLSLAGSTSSRLEAARNAHIDGNIEIGLDCLHCCHSPENLP
jgi:hypothetical protein